MGFDMVNRAQNHLLDSEIAGMFSTNSLLDEAGLIHAGSGKNLHEAAAPAFYETPKGRAALIGTHAPSGQSIIDSLRRRRLVTLEAGQVLIC